jgi:hypothetical protein
MKADVEPSSGGKKGLEGKRERDLEALHDSADDEYREGRNWMVIITLSAIIIAWTFGLVLLVWSLF